MTAKKIDQIRESATVSFNDQVKTLKIQGRDIIQFNSGEPDFDTPKIIIDACVDALLKGNTHYIQTAGIYPLRVQIAQKLERENGISFRPEEVVVTVGAKQAISEAIMAICDPGDEVIIPTPCWVSYIEMVKIAGAVPVLVNTMPDYSLDIEAIERTVTTKTRLIIINTPNNPTGVVYSMEELVALGELAVKKRFYILSDEVYEKLIYDGAQMVSIASISEEVRHMTITVNGFSKAFAMTGWRIGYAAADSDIINAIIKIQGHLTYHGTSFIQWGALEALKNGGYYVKNMVETFNRRRKIMKKKLSEIPGIRCNDPKGAFYMLPDVSNYYGKQYHDHEISNATDLCNFLLNEGSIAVVSGIAFEAPNTIRLCYATSEDKIEVGLNRMNEALSKLS